MRNEDVIRRWAQGETLVNMGRTGNLWVDRKGVLYSYALAIGYRTASGECRVGNFTNNKDLLRETEFHSKTTSAHVSHARDVAVLVKPSQVKRHTA